MCTTSIYNSKCGIAGKKSVKVYILSVETIMKRTTTVVSAVFSAFTTVVIDCFC